MMSATSKTAACLTYRPLGRLNPDDSPLMANPRIIFEEIGFNASSRPENSLALLPAAHRSLIDALWLQQRGTIDLGLERASGCLRAVFALSRDAAGFAPDPSVILAGSELEYWRSVQSPVRKRSYLTGRDAAKQAITAYAGITDPRTLEVVSGVFNQPIVRGANLHSIGVSITHSESVACAIAFPEEHPMGVDVESIDAGRAAIMERELAGTEIRTIEGSGCGSIIARVVGWTAKEALSKVLRCGLTCPYSLLTVTRVARFEGRLTGEFESFGQYRFESWVCGELVLTMVLPRRTRLTVRPASAFPASSPYFAPA